MVEARADGWALRAGRWSVAPPSAMGVTHVRTAQRVWCPSTPEHPCLSLFARYDGSLIHRKEAFLV
jgi:hypothetical protein